MRADLAQLYAASWSDLPAGAIPEALLARAVTVWIHLFGTVSFELFGHFDGVLDSREAYFDHEMSAMADLLGMP